MGRSQYDGQVRAATDPRSKSEIPVSSKTEAALKRASRTTPSDTPTEASKPPNSDWEFYHAGDSKKTEDRLKPVATAPLPAQKNVPALLRTTASAKPAGSPPKSLNAPLVPGGAYTLQVAALSKESDALELAARLQKQKFPAFVLSPQADKFYHVRVGPYADQKTADAARKGLEGAGFKAIVKH
jgi:septal ring-binding cell division protein DamX